MQTNIHCDHILLGSSYNEKFFEIKVVETIKTHVLYSVTFSKIIPFMTEREKKYSRAW